MRGRKVIVMSFLNPTADILAILSLEKCAIFILSVPGLYPPTTVLVFTWQSRRPMPLDWGGEQVYMFTFSYPYPPA